MTNLAFLGVSLGSNKSTLGGGHTHFSVEIGLNGGFSPKCVEIGRKPGFSGPGGQKHRFLGGRRNVLYNTWLAGSIADAFGSNMQFFKNWRFFGVLVAFLGQSKLRYFTDFKAHLVFRISLENKKC